MLSVERDGGVHEVPRALAAHQQHDRHVAGAEVHQHRDRQDRERRRPLVESRRRTPRAAPARTREGEEQRPRHRDQPPGRRLVDRLGARAVVAREQAARSAARSRAGSPATQTCRSSPRATRRRRSRPPPRRGNGTSRSRSSQMTVIWNAAATPRGAENAPEVAGERACIDRRGSTASRGLRARAADHPREHDRGGDAREGLGNAQPSARPRPSSVPRSPQKTMSTGFEGWDLPTLSIATNGRIDAEPTRRRERPRSRPSPTA